MPITRDRGPALEERILVQDTFAFQEEQFVPIYCKPKLIPLKTITMEKIEKIQREAQQKIREAELLQQEQQEGEEEEDRPEDSEQPVTPAATDKPADVWTADD
ncbi:unnamed protein product [Caenorhabditis auriculariae]|uniref:BBSome-interacting protein 1 n=1 Tax=Caenorhabditis auriculariae TaxID=2777116 RepID=A0A8S1GWV4_9PELO|nr:unnamed protein product [Caenorhabditis auriculariae]